MMARRAILKGGSCKETAGEKETLGIGGSIGGDGGNDEQNETIWMFVVRLVVTFSHPLQQISSGLGMKTTT